MDFLIEQQEGKVSCNFEDIKSYLSEQLEQYKGIVFSEDGKKEAKATVAQLRKEKKAFADRVKEVKVEYMKPWEEFNKKATELVDLFDEPINGINEQVQAFEQKRVEEKKALVSQLYSDIVPEEMQQFIPEIKISNPKWTNVTYSENQIKEDLKNLVINTAQAIETIKGMNSEAEEKAIRKYCESYNLTDAILVIQDYEKQKQEILERQHEEELRKAKEEARLQILEEQQKAMEIEQAKEEAKAEAVEAFIPEDDGEEAESYTYIIKMTPSAKKTLEMYMDSIGIEYDEMPF